MCQMASIRNRQPDKINNNPVKDEHNDYMALPLKDSTNSNGVYEILRPDYINGGNGE